MASTVPVNITNFRTGFDTYDQPEVMPDDAFPVLEDALCYRGVLRKRDGFQNLITPGLRSILVLTNTIPSVITTNINHGYIVGDQVIIIGALGVVGINGIIFNVIAVPAPNQFTIDNIALPGVYIAGTGIVRRNPVAGTLGIQTVSNAAAAVITTWANHNLSNNQQVLITDLDGAMGTAINNSTIPYTITVLTPTTFSIPISTLAVGAYTRGGVVHQPIMGLKSRISTTFFEDLIAFNESRAFNFLAAAGEFVDISGATVWTGNDSQFFWSMNYFGSFWATNNFDPIRYYISGTTWTNYTPTLSAVAGNVLQTALMIFPYKGRFIALNTIEGALNTNFPQRARWSAIGNPYVTVPVPAFVPGVDVNAWRDDIIGKGGFLDAPTSEKIISAGFVRDTLVVEFEHSAWRLRYTGNELLPFIWERFNSQFGAESTYSAVGFDEGIITVGRDGIIFADVNAAGRVDLIIPDQVFEIENAEFNGQRRIQGIRDFRRMLAYWTYAPDNVRYPTKVLCYNYIEKSWAIFNQSFTAYGQYRQDFDLTWAAATFPWSSDGNFWSNGNIQSGFPEVVAGNALGNVWKLQKDYTIDDQTPFNFEILTKKFNPFVQQGLQCKAIYLHILVSGTDAGQFIVEHYIDEDTDVPIETLIVPTNTIGQEKVWRRVQLSGTSQYHQFKFKFSASQLADRNISSADYDFFQYIFEFAPAGRLNYGDFTT